MKQLFSESIKKRIGYLFLILFGVIAVIAAFIKSPIDQNQDYHNFIDGNILFKLNNFSNVISNVPFLVVGLFGLFRLNSFPEKRLQYKMLFWGIIFMSIGSAYYHFNPSNSTLIFDRLPMTVVFMSLMSIIISEFINHKIGQNLLVPALLIGLASVAYWFFFNDLTFYALVQFYPMIAIPVILIFFKSNYSKVYGYWLLLVFYSIAKLCEYYDKEIFDFFRVISGHSFKHIISAVGLYILFHTFIYRSELNKISLV